MNTINAEQVKEKSKQKHKKKRITLLKTKLL